MCHFGGPTGVQPGEARSTTSNLTPGHYVFLCFVQSADGVPHLAKGMIAPLEVTEPAVEDDVPAADDWLSPVEAARLADLRFAKRRIEVRLARWTAEQAGARGPGDRALRGCRGLRRALRGCGVRRGDGQAGRPALPA